MAKRSNIAIKAEIRARKEAIIAELLEHYGHQLFDENFADTPRRFIDYLEEFHQPFDIEELLGDGFPGSDNTAMVVQRNIPFRMVCSHHLLPALGVGHVGYVPNTTVVGLSKLARLVQAVGTERPNLQEAINDRIADLLNKYLQPKGVIVVIDAEHTCMACRGVTTPGVFTTTSSVRGIYRDVPAARQEFFAIIKG